MKNLKLKAVELVEMLSSQGNGVVIACFCNA